MEDYRRCVEIPRGRPRVVELVAVALLGGLGAAEVLVPFGSRAGSGSAAVDAAAVTAVAASLWWVRRAPWLPLAVFATAWPTAVLVAGSVHLLFYGQLCTVLLVLFMCLRFGGGRVPVVAVATVAGFFLAVDVLVPEMRSPGELFFHWTVGVLVASAGWGLRRHEQRAQESTRRAVEAEVGAAERALRAVVAERTRIGRELHDIVAHAVTSMVVQAGAAQRAEDDRDYVDRALDDIRTTGSEALAEMRRLVTMLREDEAAPLAPQPRLDGLPELVRTSSVTGPPTRLEVSGEVLALPPGLDLAVYRIVQEALTNVRRHARASECVVRVAYSRDAVRLEVVDDGVGPPPASTAVAGHGLVGMRERVGMYGGRLDLGRRPEGHGFSVTAVLPVPAGAT